MSPSRRHFLLAGFCLVVLGGCVPAKSPPKKATKVVLHISAAISTREPLEKLIEEFETQENVEIRANYGATSTLGQQIEQGAPAHLFLSANEEWANRLTEKKLVREQVSLLGNELVIAVLKQDGVVVKEPRDLLSKDITHVAVADPQAVPAGMYAQQALTREKLWDDVRQKLAVGGDVRQALTYLETGAAQAAVVYATDAAASSRVQVGYRFPLDENAPIRYPLVSLISMEDPPEITTATKKLYEFLQSPHARDVFTFHGFLWLGK